MRLRRAVLLIAALLVVLGAAPAAAGAATPVDHVPSGRSSATTGRPVIPHGDPAPKLVTFPSPQRSAFTGRAAATRPGDARSRVVGLGPAGSIIEASRAEALVDADAGARLLRSANTPCSVRGPPAAA